MSLDSRLRDLLRKNSLDLPRLDGVSPAELRRQAATIWKSERREPIWKVKRRLIPVDGTRIPIRVFTPAAVAGRRKSPVVIYLHGSGWVMDTFEAEEDICAEIANRVGCLVALVEYRLAPENKFPAPLEDCYAATSWISQRADSLRADSGRLIVCGDSAGANLAAALSLLVKRRGGPNLLGQVLIVPPVDPSMSSASYRQFAKGFGAEKAMMEWLWRQYLRDSKDGRNPLVSPLRARDVRGLPPALVITAEFDPLRDEGEAYAEKLRRAGVPVRVTRYRGMVHGFPLMRGGLPEEAALIGEVGEWIKAHFRIDP